MATDFDGTFRPRTIALLWLVVCAIPVSAADLPGPSPHDAMRHPATAQPGGQGAQTQPPAGKTLVPVTDPRCSPVMPIFQTYKEVSVEEAKQPPRCDPPAR